MKKLQCIMLVDDNPDDNFFHERVIKKSKAAEAVIVKQTAMDALNFLKADKDNGYVCPDLLFLDINMPGMNGWEFLEEYNKLPESRKGQVVVVTLTTSENPEDKKKAEAMPIVNDFRTKPLTEEMLEEIIDSNFKDDLEVT